MLYFVQRLVMGVAEVAKHHIFVAMYSISICVVAQCDR